VLSLLLLMLLQGVVWVLLCSLPPFLVISLFLLQLAAVVLLLADWCEGDLKGMVLDLLS
jgi:hypothetical protein